MARHEPQGEEVAVWQVEQRRRQQLQQGLVVIGELEHAQQGCHHADFGQGEEVAAAADSAGYAPPAQGGQVRRGALGGKHQQGHAAKSGTGLCQLLEALCDQLGLCLAQGGCRGAAAPFGVLAAGGQQHLHARAVLRQPGLRARVGLARLDEEELVSPKLCVREDGLDKGEDVGVAAEVGVERNARAAGSGHALLDRLVDHRVCPAEAVDALLLVSHRGEGAQLLVADGADDAHLQGVCVLELVDHHAAEALAVRAGDVWVLLEQAVGADEEVVGVLHAAALLEGAVAAGGVLGQMQGAFEALARKRGGGQRQRLADGTAGIGEVLAEGLLEVAALGQGQRPHARAEVFPARLRAGGKLAGGSGHVLEIARDQGAARAGRVSDAQLLEAQKAGLELLAQAAHHVEGLGRHLRAQRELRRAGRRQPHQVRKLAHQAASALGAVHGDEGLHVVAREELVYRLL